MSLSQTSKLDDFTIFSQRVLVVAHARRWLGTPFCDLARVRGVGVDCAQLLAAVYHEAGIIPYVDTGYYSPQHFLHSNKELMTSFVERYAHRIEEEDAQPGDVVLYKIEFAYAHAAIIVDWPSKIIHAHKLSGKVMEMGAFEYDMERRQVRFFSFWDR